MKVYVVADYVEYEGYSEPLGVFATREEAQTYVNYLEDQRGGYVDNLDIFERVLGEFYREGSRT
jgi:hypothetical protein